jgi:hypothetical protein
MPTRIGATLLGLLGLAVFVLAANKEPVDKQTADDIAAFKAYLEKNHPGKKWQLGPSRVDGPEIKAAYGKQRFYFILSSAPLPPGAANPDLIKQYQERFADFQKNYISLAVRIDDNGKVTPLTGPKDFNVGLMKVAGDDDARKAASAILAIYVDRDTGVGAVAPDQVRVTRSEKGWTCTANKPFVYAGTVVFDSEGKCVSVSKVSNRPLPP